MLEFICHVATPEGAWKNLWDLLSGPWHGHTKWHNAATIT